MTTRDKSSSFSGSPGGVTRSLIEEAAKLLEGITPGEWWDGVSDVSIDGRTADAGVFPTVKLGTGEVLARARYVRDTKFIAAAPRLIRSLLSALTEAAPPEKEPPRWQCHHCGKDGEGEPFVGELLCAYPPAYKFFCSWECRFEWGKSGTGVVYVAPSQAPAEAAQPRRDDDEDEQCQCRWCKQAIEGSAEAAKQEQEPR